MLFQFGFYSSLLLISFTQGLLYSILLLVKAMNSELKSNYWLSFFIFLCSLYIAPWMLGFAGWYDNQPYRNFLFYAPFQHLFLIGPVIYFYTQSLLNPSFEFTRKETIHLLPGIIYVLYSVGIWIYDAYIFKGDYFYADGADKDFDSWYQNAGLISMILYFILSLHYYNVYRKFIVQVVSYADTIVFKWIKTYLMAFLVMLLLPIVFEILKSVFPDLQSYKGSWWFFLFFSIVMYYIAITGYSNPIQSAIPFKMSLFEKNPILLLENNSFEETIIDISSETFESAISPDILSWKTKIEAVLASEKLYTNPELTLTDLAIKLETNSGIISKTINQGFQMNFNDFINKYRVEAVKEKLTNNEHRNTTLLGLAFDCGFNSKATFNRAFKKHTSLSPKEYLENFSNS